MNRVWSSRTEVARRGRRSRRGAPAPRPSFVCSVPRARCGTRARDGGARGEGTHVSHIRSDRPIGVSHAHRRSARRQPGERGAGGRDDQRTGGPFDRRAGLPLSLPAGHHRPDAKAADQRRQARGHRRADEFVRQRPGIPDGGHESGGAAELRHALLQRLARPDKATDDRFRAQYPRPLLFAADARHVDRRFRLPRLAHDGD